MRSLNPEAQIWLIQSGSETPELSAESIPSRVEEVLKAEMPEAGDLRGQLSSEDHRDFGHHAEV